MSLLAVALDEALLKKLIKEAVHEAVEEMRTLSPGEDVAAPVGTDEEVQEPGTKRKRRTKAEMAAAAEASKGQAALPVPVSKVEYAEVQKAVVALCDMDRRDAVKKVLGQFGVGTARELRPEQWPECLELLQAELPGNEEESLA